MEEFEVKLPNGHAQKGLAFKKEGTQKALLILTGMNEHSHRYQGLAEFLNGVGYDVYVLDAPGQGLNAPTVDDLQKWYVGAFEDNVTAANVKIEELKKSYKAVSIMGHSMGSFMVQRYLEMFPATVASAIICGTNGKNNKTMISMGYLMAKMGTTKKNWDVSNKKMDKIGLGGYAKAVKNRKTDLDWLSYNEENVKTYMADPYCGHSDTHGFWVEFMRGMKELYKGKNLKRINPEEHILLIAGAEDPVGSNGKGPTSMANLYKKLGVKDVTLVIYPHMRHEIHNEIGHEKVYDQIASFLNAR
jgi:alpha-beta hydrolase superfamily lysophospholipase